MLQQWWLDRMATTTSPLQEKLTFFWHGHFATENEKVDRHAADVRAELAVPHAGAGNFRDLVQQMSLQPAMLLYLDNDPNAKGAPNENFARELMELFTLGVNQYTQADVVGRAHARGRATTPSTPTARQYHFYPTRHDNGLKTFMGVTRNLDGPDIIDFILSENTVKKMIAARFIAKKLWTFFAYPSPDTALLDALTQAFFASDLDITTLLRTIFLRPEFYSTTAKQGLVRSPVEWVVAVMRALDMTAEEPTRSGGWARWASSSSSRRTSPGWKNNAYWVSTTALWARADFARYLTWKAHDDGFLDQVPGLSVSAGGAGRVRRVRHRPAVDRDAQRPAGLAHQPARRRRRRGPTGSTSTSRR